MKLIALGSNLSSLAGTPAENICLAAKKLSEYDFEVIAWAPLYATAPVPKSDQPDFINTVIQVEFSGIPEAALEICHRIERDMGRIRHIKNEARVIDLDIIAWNDVVQLGPPELPHPHLHERAFVIYPLCDIAPEWAHPTLNKTAEELKRSLPDYGIQLSQEQWSGTGRYSNAVGGV